MAAGGDAEELVAVGRITKAHGIRGEVKFLPYSGDTEVLAAVEAITVTHDGHAGTHRIRRRRPQGRFVILTLAGVGDRDRAEALSGAEVSVPAAVLPPLDDNEYYWHEMLGRTVVTTAGDTLGQVERLLETGANDVLVVIGRGREYLIPVIDSVVVEVDAAAGVITVDPLPGLLDINESA